MRIVKLISHDSSVTNVPPGITLPVFYGPDSVAFASRTDGGPFSGVLQINAPVDTPFGLEVTAGYKFVAWYENSCLKVEALNMHGDLQNGDKYEEQKHARLHTMGWTEF